MNIFTIFLLNFFLNSILVFSTSWLFVELFLVIFRIKDFRIKYLSRLIPIVKIFLDLFIYSFSQWAILKNINPILCEEGTRTLFIGFGITNFLPNFFIFFHLPEGITFSLTDILALYIGNIKSALLTVFFILISLFGLTKFIISYKEKKSLMKKIISQITYITIPITNLSLQKQIKKKNIIFATSNNITSPCVLKKSSNWIISLPYNFKSFLTNDELEAILEHEIQHIKWFDYYSSIFCSFLLSINYYNPIARYWYKKLNTTKECACDQKINCELIHLATALKKCYTKKLETMPVAFFSNSSILKRLKNLQVFKKENSILKYIKGGFLVILFIALLFGKVWIF